MGEESTASGSAPIWGSGGYAPVEFRCKALVGGQGDKVPLNLARILLDC